MTCDHDLANEWARCNGKNASYITKPVIFGLCFASRLLPGPSLPETVTKEAEAVWGEVVAIVNSVHPSHSLESQFYPLFAERVTEPLMIEGKNLNE